MRHIAREGGVFVINTRMALNLNSIPDEYEFKKLYPEDREWINAGNSCIIDPSGQFPAGPLEAKEEILYANIRPEQTISAKRMLMWRATMQGRMPLVSA
jgi:nitrilase